ncbi:MAG: hypothetical protein WA941_08400 [Nitrososphaeraceae archaeon]
MNSFLLQPIIFNGGYKVKIVDNGEDCAKVYLDNFQELRLLKSKEIAADNYKNQPFEVVILLQGAIQALAYSFRPVKSILTTGSFPTTQALCPSGITAASPGPNSSSVPSSTLILPEIR